MASGQQPSMHPSSSSRRPQPPQAASQAAPDRPAPLPLKLEVFTRGTVIPAPLSEQQQEQVLQRRLKKHGAPTSAELGTRTTNATTALSSLPVAPENPMLSAVSDDTRCKQEKGGLQLLSSANSIANRAAASDEAERRQLAERGPTRACHAHLAGPSELAGAVPREPQPAERPPNQPHISGCSTWPFSGKAAAAAMRAERRLDEAVRSRRRPPRRPHPDHAVAIAQSRLVRRTQLTRGKGKPHGCQALHTPVQAVAAASEQAVRPAGACPRGERTLSE